MILSVHPECIIPARPMNEQVIAVTANYKKTYDFEAKRM
jgi:hypothetical protein